MKIFTLWEALKCGKQLADPATWKQRQNSANAISAVLGAVIVILPWLGVQVDVSQDDLLAIAGGVAALGGVLNGVLTTATSKKVGLSAKVKDNPPPDETGGNNVEFEPV